MKLVLKEEQRLMRGLSEVKLVLKKEQQFGEGAISSKVSLKRGTALGKASIYPETGTRFLCFRLHLKRRRPSFHNGVLSSRGSRVFQAQLMYVKSPEPPTTSPKEHNCRNQKT